MSKIKDYRVTVKVRNNRILRAIEGVGGTPGNKWCEDNGLIYPTINSFIAMKYSPLKKNGELRDQAMRLCIAVKQSPNDLWSEDQIYPLEKNFGEIEAGREEMALILGAPEHSNQYSIEDLSSQIDINSELTKSLDSLRPRERKVIIEKHFNGKTYEEIGNDFDVSRERIRQIEAKAFRKLRHPKISSGLQELIDA